MLVVFEEKLRFLTLDCSQFVLKHVLVAVQQSLELRKLFHTAGVLVLQMTKALNLRPIEPYLLKPVASEQGWTVLAKHVERQALALGVVLDSYEGNSQGLTASLV